MIDEHMKSTEYKILQSQSKKAEEGLSKAKERVRGLAMQTKTGNIVKLSEKREAD